MKSGAERNFEHNPNFTSFWKKRNIVLKPADHLTPFSYTFSLSNYPGPQKVISIAPILLLEQNSPIGKIQIYSEAADDQLNILFPSNEWMNPQSRIKIFNSLNKLIYAKILKSKEEPVNLRALPNGLFFLQISDKKRRA